MLGRADPGERSPQWQTLGVAGLVVLAVILCGLALTRDPNPGFDDFVDTAVLETDGATSTQEPSAGRRQRLPVARCHAWR